MTISESLARELADTRDWTLRLLADFAGDDFAFRPGPGLAHATWLCGHLAVSQHALVHVRVLGRGILDDAFCGHFTIGGPVKSTKEHSYPPVNDILRTMKEVHEKTLTVVRGIDERLLAEPAFAADGKSPHPHYKDKLGVIAHASRHEAFHAGQIALIRRLLGRSFLR